MKKDIFAEPERLNRVGFSAIRVMMEKAADMHAQGIKVIGLSAGEPNFNTPEPIKEATIKAIEENYTHYGSNRGLPRLREILAEQIRQRDGVSYDPKQEILLTAGGAEALNNAMFSTVDEGDEVIILSPAFINYKSLVNMCGGIAVELPLKAENGFQMDLDEIERCITEKTKMIVINNPNNPAGVVYRGEDLEKLCTLAVKYNLLIMSDEMYSRLVYDGKFRSIASYPGMKERAIIINGFSKTYAMTGWRLGYVQADARLLTRMVKVHQYSSTTEPTFIQVGVANALEMAETEKAVCEMVNQFKERCALVTEKLAEVPRVTFTKPQGAFYVMVDVSGTGLTGDEFATRFLEEKHVAVVPAVSLGKDRVYDNFIRISFAASNKDITEGMKRMKEFVSSL